MEILFPAGVFGRWLPANAGITRCPTTTARSGRTTMQSSQAASPAGSVFMFLQAMLGLSIRATERSVRFHHILLPESLQWIEIKNLQVGESTIDLAFHRFHGDVAVNVLRKEGDIEVVAIK